MSKIARGDGYSLPYRFFWEIRYGLMHVLGPAQLDAARDPRVAMKRDHDRRHALHAERKELARTAKA